MWLVISMQYIWHKYKYTLSLHPWRRHTPSLLIGQFRKSSRLMRVLCFSLCLPFQLSCSLLVHWLVDYLPDPISHSSPSSSWLYSGLQKIPVSGKLNSGAYINYIYKIKVMICIISPEFVSLPRVQLYWSHWLWVSCHCLSGSCLL